MNYKLFLNSGTIVTSDCQHMLLAINLQFGSTPNTVHWYRMDFANIRGLRCGQKEAKRNTVWRSDKSL